MPPLTLSSGDLLFFHDSMGVRFVQQGLMNSFLSGLFVFVPSLCWQEHCFSCEFSRKEKGRIVSRSGMERHGGLPARLGAPASAHNLPAARADCAASCRHDRAPTCACPVHVPVSAMMSKPPLSLAILAGGPFGQRPVSGFGARQRATYAICPPMGEGWRWGLPLQHTQRFESGRRPPD